YFVQLRIARLKRATTNRIDSTLAVAPLQSASSRPPAGSVARRTRSPGPAHCRPGRSGYCSPGAELRVPRSSDRLPRRTGALACERPGPACCWCR
ncbi:hypothetical protein HBB16_00495, partial [Pseudonocardia sp. MCCB 268]|nr:hypothetical protein [Pseudonocardia cytotoxica]